MQFKVPQDVLRPDKIVGFLTLRQLIIVAFGAGIAYSLYIILSKQYLLEIWLPPVAFVSLVTAAFAFVRFHDLQFEKLILVFIEYKFRPRARTWQKMMGDTVLSVLAPVPGSQKMKSRGAAEITPQERRKKLEEINKLIQSKNEQISKFRT